MPLLLLLGRRHIPRAATALMLSIGVGGKVIVFVVADRIAKGSIPLLEVGANILIAARHPDKLRFGNVQ